MTKAVKFSKAEAAPRRQALDAATRLYLATIGRKGGSVSSEAKRRAASLGGRARAAQRGGDNVAALARKHGVKRSTLVWRLAKGWPLKKALNGGGK